ncbi:MAG: pro-sigmaK processing inhibitor BofA family protein [Clostridiales bacterium]|nr:pro-sigmaK processing inhibitor BofA family protein [Lachnospiraceae bacterium]MCD8046381.1 pro-sigmaK processing inhibitor BofA family protein [Clostridiales bacterium]MCD8323601.1 pro-sigmaK processing inhibitor BofA family protein [Clostridiales bacterium]MCD8333476.1 pro-sigmaK processing inhibitor BofA family protein [Clostridiales bacterium]
MDTKLGIAVIAGVCIFILLIGILKKKGEILLNFATRAVVCFIAVYFINSFLASRGVEVAVGFNLISLLTLGSLGFSGMAALYGILLLQLL